MIIDSFRNKNYSVFPPTWTRLDPDPAKGAEGLAKELGDNGHFAVIYSDEGVYSREGMPLACSGFLPYRGDNWINEVDSKSDEQLANASNTTDNLELLGEKISSWEICCFCVHPSHRGKGLSQQLLAILVEYIQLRGGGQLFSNYAIDETGEFWPKLGFETIPGVGGMLLKGFKVDPGKEGLRADIHFRTGVKVL
jgi:GNAT superfamily N-acetyltransferase